VPTLLRLLLGGALTFGALGAVALPASAAVSGPCTGSATFTPGPDGTASVAITHRNAGDRTFVIARRSSVAWQAAVPGPPGTYAGSVAVDLPAPFGSLAVKEWSGTSSDPEDEGTQRFDVPGIVPGGTTLTLDVAHRDANGTCAGSATLQIEGNALGSPATWVSLVITVVTGAGLVALAWPLFGGRS